MQFDHRDCMFCHERLEKAGIEPANLAFLDHVGRRGDCSDAFEAWKLNMDADFRGD